MISTAKKSLLDRARRGKSVRDRLVENNLSEGIASQIAATRDKRGWTQATLAEEANIANNLPRLEDPEYGKHTISTLKKLASALNVALVVRFVPFSQYIDWLSGTAHKDEGINPDALAVPSFDDEEKSGRLDQEFEYLTVYINTPAVPYVKGVFAFSPSQENIPPLMEQRGLYQKIFTIPVREESVA